MKTEIDIELVEFSEIVDWVYQGAIEVAVWPTVAQKICDWLGAKSCIICTPDFTAEQGGFAITYQFNSLGLYDAKFNAHNIWEMRAFERFLLSTGSVIRDQELVTDQEFLESILYKEYLSHINIGRMVTGVVFDPSDNEGKAIVCTCLNALDEPFTERESDKIKLLLPHLSRALGVMFKLRNAEFKVASSLRALNCLSRGVLLLNALGQVCYVNDSARYLLERNDGLRLKPTVKPDIWQLQAGNAKMQTLLDDAISESVEPNFYTTRHFSQGLNVERPSGKSPYMLSFSTLSDQHEFEVYEHLASAIVFIYDVEKPVQLNNAVLETSFDLSKKELKVAHLLVNGYSLEKAAEFLKITENTIKTHLKSIHVKTKINSRAKLVKLLMTLSSD